METIRSFVDSIYDGKTNINEAEMDQTRLTENMVKLNNNSKSKIKKKARMNYEILVFIKVKK